MTTTETRPHYDQEYGTHSQYHEPEKKSHIFLILVIIALALTSTSGTCSATNVGLDDGRPVDAF